jgi:integrase
MTTKRIRGSEQLTDKAIKAWLRSAPDGASLHDGGGLYLRRRSEGAYWALRQISPATGARTWAALFPDVTYPAATLAEARRAANTARLRAAQQATDLVRDRRAAAQAIRAEAAAQALEAQRTLTLRQLFERWASTELAPHIGADGRRIGRKDSGGYTKGQFDRHVFPTLGGTPAPVITKAHLLTILDGVKAKGLRRTANVLLSDLKQMFRFAVARELVERNPLETVTKRDVGGKETERNRVLSGEEIRALAAAMPRAAMTPRSAAAVWLILATGCRVGEAMQAKWSHVSTAARIWHLPVTKNGRSHTIHLSPFAVRQLEVLAEVRESDLERRRRDSAIAQRSEWLFPNAANTGPVDVKSFGKQLADRQREPERRFTRRSKNTSALRLSGGRWTAHDLRRTAATLMAELGISGDVIDECLNHVIESRVRRTYIRDRRLVDQARAFEALGARLAALVDGAPQADNVVELKAA